MRIKRKTRRRPKASLIRAADNTPRLIPKGSRLEVWLMQGDSAIKRVGSVSVTLAHDALRHGEDLVADLFDAARRDIERRQQARTMAR